PTFADPANGNNISQVRISPYDGSYLVIVDESDQPPQLGSDWWGGLWRSTDEGTTWSPVYRGTPGEYRAFYGPALWSRAAGEPEHLFLFSRDHLEPAQVLVMLWNAGDGEYDSPFTREIGRDNGDGGITGMMIDNVITQAGATSFAASITYEFGGGRLMAID